jgi:hypothetical protein
MTDYETCPICGTTEPICGRDNDGRPYVHTEERVE